MQRSKPFAFLSGKKQTELAVYFVLSQADGRIGVELFDRNRKSLDVIFFPNMKTASRFAKQLEESLRL